MFEAKDFFDLGLKFHGHKCPAMPLGLKAACAAMNTLGVERAKDKELMLLAETADNHAAGCFVDGLMTVTGCTYGKSNIKKLYYGKMAFTLIDIRNKKAVRVSLKPKFFEKMLESPFIAERKKGIAPQDVDPKIADPLIERVLNLKNEEFLDISPVFDYEYKKVPGVMEADFCDVCNEAVFIDKLKFIDGKQVCIPCSENLAAK
jgi:formylmethanofuran dehydrogenase subunit E